MSFSYSYHMSQRVEFRFWFAMKKISRKAEMKIESNLFEINFIESIQNFENILFIRSKLNFISKKKYEVMLFVKDQRNILSLGDKNVISTRSGESASGIVHQEITCLLLSISITWECSFRWRLRIVDTSETKLRRWWSLWWTRWRAGLTWIPGRKPWDA